jgi:hypothetical protein
MIAELTTLLTNKNRELIKFDPEIKVKRENDTLYISEVKKTKMGYMVVIELYRSHGKNDKGTILLASLDTISLNAILTRVKN